MKAVLASRNPKKLEEMKTILSSIGVEVVMESEVGVDIEVEETGTTFEENSLLKAKAVMEATGMAAIADDSGLMVDALNGEPGVYSARYGGPGATDEEKVQKLLKNIENVPEEKRTARFVSAICCLFPNGKELMVRGECPGKIAYAPAGEGGFGYDPVFVVEGGKTFAELTAEEKDAVSHRGAALRKLKAALRETLEGAKEC